MRAAVDAHLRGLPTLLTASAGSDPAERAFASHLAAEVHRHLQRPADAAPPPAPAPDAPPGSPIGAPAPFGPSYSGCSLGGG